eukprot:4983513-Prymnesium_polylepis.1
MNDDSARKHEDDGGSGSQHDDELWAGGQTALALGDWAAQNTQGTQMDTQHTADVEGDEHAGVEHMEVRNTGAGRKRERATDDSTDRQRHDVPAETLQNDGSDGTKRRKGVKLGQVQNNESTNSAAQYTRDA